MSGPSLASRLTLVQQATTLAAIVVFAGSSLALTAHVLRTQQDAFLVETARRMAHAYDDELIEQHDPVLAAAAVVREDATPGVTVLLTDAAGRTLGSFGANGSRRHAGSVAESPPGPRVAIAHSASGAIVRASMSDALYHAGMTALGRSLLLAALPLLLLSLLLGQWIARRSLRPLSAMAARAGGIAIDRGERSLGPRAGFEEIDRLSGAFDRLLARLDDALRAERRLTADASHELRTPLTVISGELEIATERAAAVHDSRLDDSLRTASRQVRALRELVDAILLLHRSGDVTALQNSPFEPVNLSDLVREVVTDCGLRLPGRVRDLAVEAPDEVLVAGHAGLLESAIRNLVDNAIQFTRRGEPVRIRVSADGAVTRVVTEDGGPGLPPGEEQRIFDPFYRGAEARAGAGGSGLGLPILRRVAHAHGGDVVAGRSELGGARFELTLPALGE